MDAIIPCCLLFDSISSGKLNPGSDAAAGSMIEKEKKILCRLCEEVITHEDEKTFRQGSFIHSRENPSGITFEFGCYENAPGCANLGNPTTEHTWFSGYSWNLAVCRGCGEHLGWLFRGEAPFFGLIQERLKPEE